MAKKIIREAARYGIGTEDLIFDGLCMTVSSDSKGALTTLETLRRIRDELGCKSVLGVSNISFGLPQREIINASFFTMAMECGLSAAIVNPNSEAMIWAYYSFNALMDMDPQCGEYIRIYGGQAGSLGKTLPRNPGAGSAGAAGGGLGAEALELPVGAWVRGTLELPVRAPPPAPPAQERNPPQASPQPLSKSPHACPPPSSAA